MQSFGSPVFPASGDRLVEIKGKMRDLLYKNLTSQDMKKKAISCVETTDSEGVRSVIRRRFICIAKEVREKDADEPVSHTYVLKEKNTLEQREKFSCRIKGRLYASVNGRVFRVIFAHTLKIDLAAIGCGISPRSKLLS